VPDQGTRLRLPGPTAALARLSHRLEGHPQARAIVHRSADRALRDLARLGLDLNALRIRPGVPAPAGTSIHSIPVRPAQLVAVRRPVAAFDLEPAGVAGLAERISRGYSRPADCLLELGGGRFELPSGFISLGGRLPSQAIPFLYFPHGHNLLPALRCLYGRATTVGDGILIHLPLAWSYYHWLCEVLPRALIAAAHAPELPLYLNDKLPPFVFESLRHLGLHDRCVRLPAGVYEARRLLAMSFERAEWPVPEDLLRIRDGLAALAEPAVKPGGEAPARRRILISRADAIDRRTANEDQLLDELSDLGFERVSLTGLSLAQQVRLFSVADMVVAAHGAGLTNLLFAPAHCRVVEIAVESHLGPTYQILTSLLGQRYGYVRGEEHRRDVWVDPGGVRTVLGALDQPAPADGMAAGGALTWPS